ncbi:hypothetical protein NZK35_16345 [Stieleria sp. ICT_E10.1]|uniref:hypothetical protein n=1 Tax=Stieleria sedimenti TaxID=2976331 RepID=UPI0021806163|nr:hypothetical protein [Stieleria sedimenti]MCS7468223.1 hypothetical protein [Stieleria sedimenti]
MIVIRALCFSVFAAWGSMASAGVMLDMDAGSTDLSHLTVGDSFTVEVSLSGLTGELAALAGSIQYTPLLTADELSLTPGAIVPDPSDLLLAVDPVLNDVDAEFFQFSGPNISADGQFFSFQLTATSVGTGSIEFAPFSLFYLDQDYVLGLDIATNALDFTVTSGASGAVPEPTSFAIFSMLPLLAFGSRRRRKC